VSLVHHSAIVARDLDASLRFWRDGIGFAVMMDMDFDGDWQTLFGARSNRLHSVFLGDPAHPDAGIVELVQFETDAGESPAVEAPRNGFFLLSCYVDVDATLARLRDLGLGGAGSDAPRRITVPGPNGTAVQMATVRDPDGVLVELIGIP
jgi:catechol 2,3-dioxygenase-like lactoylglutathione lyase family enzyme